MIVNLVGPIASGKSSFARWFREKHPSFFHFDIAFMRECYEKDEEAWKAIKTVLCSVENSIVESTGLHYRISELWTPKLVRKGIYTVKFMGDVETLNKRICKRDRDITLVNDEIYENQVFASTYHELPTNLLVWMAERADYPEIERYISKAKRKIERRKK